MKRFLKTYWICLKQSYKIPLYYFLLVNLAALLSINECTVKTKIIIVFATIAVFPLLGILYAKIDPTRK